jgi:hypothetical protein
MLRHHHQQHPTGLIRIRHFFLLLLVFELVAVALHPSGDDSLLESILY